MAKELVTKNLEQDIWSVWKNAREILEDVRLARQELSARDDLHESLVAAAHMLESAAWIVGPGASCMKEAME